MSFGLSDDLTLTLLIQAHQEATEVIDDINDHIQQFVEQSQEAADSAGEMGDAIDTSWTGAASTADILEAQTSRLAQAQLAATDAAAALADANKVVAETGGADADALAAQSAALDAVAAANARVASSSAAVDSTVAAQTQEVRAAAAADDEAAASGGLLHSAFMKMAMAGTAVTLVMGVIAKMSVDAATAYQTSTAKIAASGNMSMAAAKRITTAFLSTAGKTTMAAQTIADAYSQVVGVLGFTAGHALSAGQALKFMTTQAELAEATGTSLGAVTSSTAKLMQAFNMSVRGAATATDALYVGSRDTGQGVSQLATQITRMKSRLGELSPSLKTTVALVVDLAHHGETGRVGMTVLNTALNTLLKTTASAVPTAAEVATAFKKLSPQVQGAAQMLETGAVTSTQFSDMLKDMNPEVAQTATQFESLWESSQESITQLNALKTTPAQQELSALGISLLNASGHFIGMGAVIEQLQPKLEGMTYEQRINALTALFGEQSAYKLYTTIMAGGAAYKQATAQVDAHKSVQLAAAKATRTFKADLEKLKSAFDDLKIVIGNAVLPLITELIKKMVSGLKPVIEWIKKHKELTAIIFGVVAGLGVLITILGIAGLAFGALGPAIAVVGTIFEAFISTFAANPIILILVAIAIAALELYKHWHTVWTEIKRIASDAWHFIYNNVCVPIKDAFEDVITFIRQHWEVLLGIITGPFGAAIIAIVHFRRQIVQFVGDAISDVVTFFEKLPGRILGAITGLAKDFYHLALRWVDEIIHGFEGIGGKIMHMITGGLGDIGHDVLHGLSDLNPLHWFSEGGLVTKPTLGVIGENGPEYVIPTTMLKGRTDLFGSTGIQALPRTLAAAGVGGGSLGVPGSVVTVYQIETLTVVAQNPAQLQQQLAQRSRTAALSSKALTAVNTGVST